jgi:hypothetical protein
MVNIQVVSGGMDGLRLGGLRVDRLSNEKPRFFIEFPIKPSWWDNFWLIFQ